MGTDMLAFANFLLILQLVSTEQSGYPAHSQLEQWNDAAIDRQGNANRKYYFLEDKKPISEGGLTTAPTHINMDDINEMQFPPPPTQEDVLAEIRFEDNNPIRGTSENFTPIDINVLSGAGHLGTNEIVKLPNAKPEIDPLSISNNNSYDNKEETNKERAPAAKKQYSYPELDKAVENAVNNLPSSDDSPVVPLIKLLNERNHEKSRDANLNPQDQAWDKFYQNRLILKLANKVQKQIQEKNQNPQESVVQEQQERDKSSQLENQNEANGEDQPCDCEGECDGEPTHDQTKTEKEGFGEELPKDQPEPEKNSESGCGEEVQDQIETGNTLDKGPQARDDDNQINDRHQENLAHVIIMLRRSKMEEKETMQNPALTPITPFGNEQLFRSRENPPLADIFLRLFQKSNAMNIIPPSSFERNEDYSRHDQVTPSATTGGCDDNGNEDESDQENNRSSFPRVELDENEIDSSEYGRRASFTRYPSDDQDLSIQNKEVVQQSLPKELFLMNALINIMKQKAAANALKERQEKQALPLPYFEESSNTPSPPISRLVIIRHQPAAAASTLPPPQLPPLYFPDENSGYNIKHLENYRAFPIFRDLKLGDQKTETEHVIHVKTLNQSQEDANSDGFAQKNINPEEIPWFIKNMLAHLNGKVGRGGLRPTPVPLVPVQTPTEENNPVLLRALLAPYAL